MRPEVQHESGLQGSTATPGAWTASNAAEATYGHVLTSRSPNGRAREDTQPSHRPKLSSLSIPVQASAHLDINSISSISSMTSSITTASPLPIDTWLKDQGTQIMKHAPLVGLQKILFPIVPSETETAKDVAVPGEIILEARVLVAKALEEVQQPPYSALSDLRGHLSSQIEGCNVSGEDICRRAEKLPECLLGNGTSEGPGHQHAALVALHKLLFAVTPPETETAKDVTVPSGTLLDAKTLVTEALEEVQQVSHSALTDLGGHLSRQTKGSRVSDVEIRGRKELSECSGNGAIEDAGPDPELLSRQRRRETLTMAKIITPFIV